MTKEDLINKVEYTNTAIDISMKIDKKFERCKLKAGALGFLSGLSFVASAFSGFIQIDSPLKLALTSILSFGGGLFLGMSFKKIKDARELSTLSDAAYDVAMDAIDELKMQKQSQKIFEELKDDYTDDVLKEYLKFDIEGLEVENVKE